jgi:hypothetical protein
MVNLQPTASVLDKNNGIVCNKLYAVTLLRLERTLC